MSATGGLRHPLTNRQKGVLCQRSNRAYDLMGVRGMDRTEFRRIQQETAVGKSSLTHCTQQDYRPLKRHFEMLSGKGAAAFRTAMSEAFEARDQALARLRREMQRSRDVIHDPEEWVSGFLYRKRKIVNFNQAPPEDIWHAIKTLSSRAAALRKKRKTQEHRNAAH